MTPAEFKTARIALFGEFGVPACAKALKVDRVSVYRYEKGGRKANGEVADVPGPVEVCMGFFLTEEWKDEWMLEPDAQKGQ